MSEPHEESGSFEQISLALLLIRALDRRWTGTLILSPPSGEREIVEFQRGLVCRAIVPDQYARLGQLLVDAKVVTEVELDRALEKDGVLGAALLEDALIDEKTLQRALVLQLLRRTSRLFARTSETKWSFSPARTFFEGMPEGVRIDTLRVLWAGLSANPEMGNWLPLTLQRIGESSFQVRPDLNLKRYGFTGDALRLAQLLQDERLSVAQLLAKEIAPEEVVRQIVYLLAITRYLDFSAAAGADSAPPVPSGVETNAVVDEPSIADEPTVDESSASESPTAADEPQAVASPRRVARIKLRRVAMRPAAPDPPGSGEHRAPAPRASGDSSEGPPSSGQRAAEEIVDTPPASSSERRSERRVSGGEADPSSEGKAPAAEITRDHLSTEIQGRLARLNREDPFSLLNVSAADLRVLSEDELTDVLWTAYEECSRRWHPDNCPSELSDLREGMARIYDGITEAFMRLTDASQRAELLDAEDPPTMRSEEAEPEADESEPDPPPSGDRPIEQSLTSAELHAKALVALSEQRLEEALRLCRSACDAKPDDPDYLASSVWIRASMEQPETKVLLLDLDGLLRGHPSHVQARFYRGVLRRRLGSDNAAKRDFERVLELQEGHAGAKAQLAALMKRKKATK